VTLSSSTLRVSTRIPLTCSNTSSRVMDEPPVKFV
jgi:hypothetical protein